MKYIFSEDFEGTDNNTMVNLDKTTGIGKRHNSIDLQISPIIVFNNSGGIGNSCIWEFETEKQRDTAFERIKNKIKLIQK